MKALDIIKTLFHHKLFSPLRQIRQLNRNILTQEPHWVRKVMNLSISEFISNLNTEKLDAVEISGTGNSIYNWKSYTSYSFPEFDLLNPGQINKQFDAVLCEQVLEHVQDPFQATRTLYDLVAPGGVLVVSTPFFIRLHSMPDDYWRFTPSAITILLEKAGFEAIDVHTWGNKSAVKNNLDNWQSYRFYHSLRNKPWCPVVVWAFARKPF
jgi:SAM-dependent methyltransferase